MSAAQPLPIGFFFCFFGNFRHWLCQDYLYYYMLYLFDIFWEHDFISTLTNILGSDPPRSTHPSSPKYAPDWAANHHWAIIQQSGNEARNLKATELSPKRHCAWISSDMALFSLILLYDFSWTALHITSLPFDSEAMRWDKGRRHVQNLRSHCGGEKANLRSLQTSVWVGPQPSTFEFWLTGHLLAGSASSDNTTLQDCIYAAKLFRLRKCRSYMIIT